MTSKKYCIESQELKTTSLSLIPERTSRFFHLISFSEIPFPEVKSTAYVRFPISQNASIPSRISSVIEARETLTLTSGSNKRRYHSRIFAWIYSISFCLISGSIHHVLVHILSNAAIALHSIWIVSFLAPRPKLASPTWCKARTVSRETSVMSHV